MLTILCFLGDHFKQLRYLLWSLDQGLGITEIGFTYPDKPSFGLKTRPNCSDSKRMVSMYQFIQNIFSFEYKTVQASQPFEMWTRFQMPH